MREGFRARISRSIRLMLGLTIIACLAAGCIGQLTGIGFNTGNQPGVVDGRPAGGGGTGGGLPTGGQYGGLQPPTQPPGGELDAEDELLVGVEPGADVEAIARAVGAEVISSPLELINVAYLRLKGEGVSLAEARRVLEGIKGVRYAVPNERVYHLPYMKGPGGDFQAGVQMLSAPGDPHFETYQFGPQRIRAPEAWAAGFTGDGVVIAVVDTGVDPTHPEFAGRLLKGINLSNPASPTDQWHDEEGHGTHVAGIAAAGMNDGGIVGVAPRALIFPIRVFGAPGQPTSFAAVALGVIAAAAPWAFGLPNPPADVINLSLGSNSDVPVMADAINFAVEQGIVVVAAAGNGRTREVTFPAAYGGVIGVAATDPQDRRAYFSTRGNHVSVAAPGLGIWSAVPYGIRYDVYQGTSMAAPHVAGAAALLLEADPGLTPERVKFILEMTADPGDEWNEELGYGRIDVARALAWALGEEVWEYDRGEIAVSVEDQAGNPIAGADVTLYRDDEPLKNIRTGGRGILPPFGRPGGAIFRDLEAGGGYSVIVTLDPQIHGGYDGRPVSGIEVQAGKTTEVLVVF